MRDARGGELTTAQTEDLDVVPQFGLGEGQDGGREEHGLVIGMGD